MLRHYGLCENTDAPCLSLCPLIAGTMPDLQVCDVIKEDFLYKIRQDDFLSDFLAGFL